MNGVERRLNKLEALSQGAAVAEDGLRAIERFRAGNDTKDDLAAIARPGALAAVSDEDLARLIKEVRQSLSDANTRSDHAWLRNPSQPPGAAHSDPPGEGGLAV